METISINAKEFKIIKLLGKGKGGYSYLVSDYSNNLFVVKQIHHEPCSYYTFGNKLESEINDYNKLNYHLFKHFNDLYCNINPLFENMKEL